MWLEGLARVANNFCELCDRDLRPECVVIGTRITPACVQWKHPWGSLACGHDAFPLPRRTATEAACCQQQKKKAQGHSHQAPHPNGSACEAERAAVRRQMHGGAAGGRLRCDGAEAAGLQPGALSKPETVPAQEHHATGVTSDGRPAAPRGRLGRAEETGGAKWHGGGRRARRFDAARPRAAAGRRGVAGAAPGASPEPEREGPRHGVDVVGLGFRKSREATTSVPRRAVSRAALRPRSLRA